MADCEVEVEAIGAAARDRVAVLLAGPVVALLAAEVARPADVGAVGRVPLVVDAGHLEVVAVGPRLLDEVVAGGVDVAGLVGQRVVLQHVERDRVEQVLRDHVARERIAGDDAVHQPRRVGVVDLGAGGEQLGEVAVAHPLGRHRRRERLDRVVLQPLVRPHEEGAVLEDGPAERAAEAVVVAGRDRAAAGVGGEQVGRARVVAVEVGGGAAQHVGAALQRQVHRAGAGVADLRVVGRGLDLEFLDGVGRRLDADAGPGHDVAGAVDGEVAVDRPADGEAAQVVVVHRPLQRVGALERGAGDEAGQAVGGAVSERNLGDQLAVDHLAHGRGAGLEHRPIGDDADFLGDAAGFERHVVLHLVADADLDVVVDAGAEAVQDGGHPVGAGQEVERGVASLVGGRGRRRGVRVDVDDRHRDAGQHRAGRVGDAAGNRPAGVLGAGWRRGEADGQAGEHERAEHTPQACAGGLGRAHHHPSIDGGTLTASATVHNSSVREGYRSQEEAVK